MLNYPYHLYERLFYNVFTATFSPIVMEKRTPWDKYQLILPSLSQDVSITELSRTHNIPVRTLRDWKKKFINLGLPGLDHIKRKDQGTRRCMSQQMQELIGGFAILKPKLKITAIYQKIVLLAERANQKPPSYTTVYNVVRKIKPALITLSHEGVKAYRQKFELIYRRECKAPNEIWQCDHTELDIYVLDSDGKEVKTWLTIIMDDYSRAIAGFLLSVEAPSAINTALALRQAISRKEEPCWQICGIPQILYTDHGTDFMSVHIQQVCVNLKIRHFNSAVGRPQGRGKIERFFRTLNDTLLASLPGYSQNGKPLSKPKLTFTELNAAIKDFILKTYNHQIHSSTGVSPLQKWSEGFLPQLPDSFEELDLLLLYIQKPRRVQRDGIRFHGMRYISIVLAAFVGETVTIRYDPNDLAEIKVYHQDNFLCKAVCQDLSDMTISLKEIKAARSSVKKDLFDQLRQSKAFIKGITGRKGPSSPTQSVVREQKTSKLRIYENE